MSNYLEATESQPVETPIEIFKPNNLTRKQTAFVRHLIDNPKASATEAAANAYDVASRDTARSIASENLTKPNIIMALGESSALFESAIVGVVRDWKDADSPRKREIALDAAKFGHDKIHGKATVKVEQQTQIVQIAINLTGDGEAPPPELLTGDLSV